MAEGQIVHAYVDHSVSWGVSFKLALFPGSPRVKAVSFLVECRVALHGQHGGHDDGVFRHEGSVGEGYVFHGLANHVY